MLQLLYCLRCSKYLPEEIHKNKQFLAYQIKINVMKHAPMRLINVSQYMMPYFRFIAKVSLAIPIVLEANAYFGTTSQGVEDTIENTTCSFVVSFSGRH